MAISIFSHRRLTLFIFILSFFNLSCAALIEHQKIWTYRQQNSEKWITLKKDPLNLVTYHFKDNHLVGKNLNDRAEVVEEYLGEFCSQGIIQGEPKIYTAIKNVLLKLPTDAFLVVTNRSRPLLFTEYYHTGSSRIANTSEISILKDDPPTFTQGLGIVKLSSELEEASDPDAIEAVIAHEIAHRILGHAQAKKSFCQAEKEANQLIKTWGFDEAFKKAKASWGSEGKSDCP